MKISHVSVAVKDITKFNQLFSHLFGVNFTAPKTLNDQKVKLSFGETEGSKLEVISPSSPDSSVAKFLEKRGEGLHHICFEVEDLGRVLADLKTKGVEVIGEPKLGGSGKKIVFLHPKSTGGVLVELKER